MYQKVSRIPGVFIGKGSYSRFNLFIRDGWGSVELGLAKIKEQAKHSSCLSGVSTRYSVGTVWDGLKHPSAVGGTPPTFLVANLTFPKCGVGTQTAAGKGAPFGIVSKYKRRTTRCRSFNFETHRWAPNHALQRADALDICAGQARIQLLAEKPLILGFGAKRQFGPHISVNNSALTEQRFSQMIDFGFVGNLQKLRAGTCVIHFMPRCPAKPIRVAR